MRVVAGSARGRRLDGPTGAGTRPTSDRVRESVFNALLSRMDLEGTRVLDLFAGTGALGIEALSRGASEAVFVESDRNAVATIRRNLTATGLAERATVVTQRAENWLRGPAADGESFDVAFCDPPYAFDDWEALLVNLPARLAVLESDRPVAVAGWAVARERRYGTTFVTFAEPAAGGTAPPSPLEASELP
jgi:16S rRNA (guanine966-N2)-methyltransferase